MVSVQFILGFEGTSFQVPLEEGGRYDCTLQWDDRGCPHRAHITNYRVHPLHFQDGGLHTVVVSGYISGFTFQGKGYSNAKKARQLTQFGSLQFGNSGAHFTQ